MENEENENDYTRIKTFQDAVKKLGAENGLVKEYKAIRNIDISSDLFAYLRLRIITAALNEGWEPDFTYISQDKYWPWFWIYSEAEWNAMSDTKRKSGVFFGGSAYDGAFCGFLYALTNSAPSYASANLGSRLCFKNKELSEYAGRQFIGLYFDFLIGGYGKQD